MTQSSPESAPDFDAMCDLFTSYARTVADWQLRYYGAAYSTRLKQAIADMKFAIAEAEKHPEIGHVPGLAQTPAVQTIPLPLWAAEDILKYMRRIKVNKEALHPLGLENLLDALVSELSISSTDQSARGASSSGGYSHVPSDSSPDQPAPFYGAQCGSYPNCTGGCGLGCTHEIELAQRGGK